MAFQCIIVTEWPEKVILLPNKKVDYISFFSHESLIKMLTFSLSIHFLVIKSIKLND